MEFTPQEVLVLAAPAVAARGAIVPAPMGQVEQPILAAVAVEGVKAQCLLAQGEAEVAESLL